MEGCEECAWSRPGSRGTKCAAATPRCSRSANVSRDRTRSRTHVRRASAAPESISESYIRRGSSRWGWCGKSGYEGVRKREYRARERRGTRMYSDGNRTRENGEGLRQQLAFLAHSMREKSRLQPYARCFLDLKYPVHLTDMRRIRRCTYTRDGIP